MDLLSFHLFQQSSRNTIYKITLKRLYYIRRYYFPVSAKSDKASFIIYADLEFLIEKIDACKNNPKNSFTTKISKHIPSGFSMSTISSL